jgi:dihydroflavonol-4-reductase
VKAFVTGGTGFIGSRVVKRLRDRGDDVVVLARSPEKAAGLDAEVVQGDLSDADAIHRGVQGCDAVFHIAADYRVGMPKSKRESMYDSNVRGTERVLDAAADAGVDRIVYVSTVNAFGNTNGRTVDETYSRDEADGFVSYYDETKYRAHKLAQERAATGVPVVIVQPGSVYGPGDRALVGQMIEQASTGKMPAKAFPELGLNMVHVDDVADGILLAYAKGRVGESYVLGGQLTTQGELIQKAAEIGGKKPPRMTVPPVVLKSMIPIGRFVGPAMGLPPNFREMISAAHNVTYLAKDDKARSELGYQPRDLDTGLRQTIEGGRADAAAAA